MKVRLFFSAITVVFWVYPVFCLAQVEDQGLGLDNDIDGLTNAQEIQIYKTNPLLMDTDGDGYSDGTEIKYNYDPNKNFDDKLQKSIYVNLSGQTLSYALGPYVLSTIKVSSGLPKTPTPAGEFSILKKMPLVNYGIRGGAFYYPNTRWNMLFKYSSKGNFYIHGAYWHNNFGQQASHGCVNVSYEDVEALYNWADTGTKVFIE